jgi:hypothetical protein
MILLLDTQSVPKNNDSCDSKISFASFLSNHDNTSLASEKDNPHDYLIYSTIRIRSQF